MLVVWFRFSEMANVSQRQHARRVFYAKASSLAWLIPLNLAGDILSDTLYQRDNYTYVLHVLSLVYVLMYMRTMTFSSDDSFRFLLSTSFLMFRVRETHTYL